MKRLFYCAVAAGIVLAAAGHYFVRMDAYKGFGAPVIVDVPRGSSITAIGRILEEKGIVRHWALFTLARLPNPRALPQAGEYEFTCAATPHEVYLRLARGDIYTVSLVVPEGANVFDIAKLVESAGLGKADRFIREALPDEGYLFPATYRFSRKTREPEIARAMRQRFDKVWREIGGDAPKQRTVTLASLVEREARIPDERERISGVFVNRLEKGMPLQCDPTVVYAALLEGVWRGAIHRSDLDRAHAYNTYKNAGLPPGPIANPGRASLLAAMNPAQTEDLYFVVAAEGGGAHIFSKDYADHQKAVAAYRRSQQKADGNAGKEATSAGPSGAKGRRSGR